MIFIVALTLLGCKRDEPKAAQEYSLYVLGQLDRTHVSIWLNQKALAGGYLSTEDSIGVAFQMPFIGNPGDTLELRVNEDGDNPIKSSFIVPAKLDRHILAAVQKSEITFETQKNPPSFK